MEFFDVFRHIGLSGWLHEYSPRTNRRICEWTIEK
jgi:hypothetical protein